MADPKTIKINYNSRIRFLNLGATQKIDPEVEEEGGGNLSEQVWEREQAGLNEESGPLIGTIGFDEATLGKIRTKKSNGKEL